MEREKSKKVYIILAFFLGDFGIHQFYLRNYKRGILYLLFSWTFIPILISFYDIITANKYFKKDNNFESNNNLENYKEYTIKEIDDLTSKVNVYNREDIKESTLFYNEEDIILEKYKHLQTPEYIKKSLEYLRKKEYKSSGVYMQIYSSNEDFAKDSLKYANKTGVKCRYIPLHAYWTTFKSMNEDQKNWYFYWRQSVLNGNYIDTDLSYICLFIYELLNYTFNERASFNISMLERLSKEYGDKVDKLNHYINPWIRDFLIELGEKQLENSGYFLGDSIYEELKQYENSIDKISMSTWKKFICGYTKTKFFEANKNKIYNQFKINMMILSDFYKQHKSSIFQEWFEEVEESKSIHLFNSAVIYRNIKPIVINIKEYQPKKKMYDEITQMFRLTENIVRKNMGDNRQIKVDTNILSSDFTEYLYNTLEFTEMDKNIKKRFKNVVTKGKDTSVVIPNKKDINNIKENDKENFIEFDNEKIASLDEESNNLVKLFNEQYEENKDVEEEIAEDIVSEDNKEIEENNKELESIDISTYFKNTLSEDEEGYIKSLTKIEKNFLCEFENLKLDSRKVIEYSRQNKIMPSVLINNINEKSQQFLEDIFIELENNIYCIYEDYDGIVYKIREEDSFED